MYHPFDITLIRHTARYPKLTAQDVIKLAFQNEFGGGHLIADPAESLARLKQEYTTIRHDFSEEIYEDIGNGLARVMLGAIDDKKYPLEELNDKFVRSATEHTGDKRSFRTKLGIALEAADRGLFDFMPCDLKRFLMSYSMAGYPTISHSEQYRAAYAPAYRVVIRPSNSVDVSVAADAIFSAAKVKTDRHPVIVAIDGRCTSGKSTLARVLAEKYGVPVLHMDDFFLRPEQRAPERFDVPGENIDHERFLAEVLTPLSRGEAFTYRPFVCADQSLGAPISFAPAEIVVVEGSYACHPALADHYAVRVFVDLSPEEQYDRLLAREGEDGMNAFIERWIPLEEKYFASIQPKKNADLRFELNGISR